MLQLPTSDERAPSSNVPTPKRPKATTTKTPAPTKGKRSSFKEGHPDAALISACVSYAQNSAAWHAGFKVDPSGDAEFAGCGRGELGEKFIRSLKRELTAIASMRATTPDGIRTKARIVPIAIHYDGGRNYMSNETEKLLLSLADDVLAFVPASGAELDALPDNQ